MRDDLKVLLFDDLELFENDDLEVLPVDNLEVLPDDNLEVLPVDDLAVLQLSVSKEKTCEVRGVNGVSGERGSNWKWIGLVLIRNSINIYIYLSRHDCNAPLQL